MTNILKEKMEKGPVFGMTVYNNTPAIIEALGYFGFDFAFIDAEHTPNHVGFDMEKLIMAARLSGVSPLVRVTRPDEIEIRKALEMGAEGVIIPHVHDRAEAEICVKGAKFPMEGRRGYDSTVRSGRYGGAGFNANDYVAYSNKTELVIPMAEDFEFMDNIEEIFEVPGIDAINFGPADFASSKGILSCYKLDTPEVQEALETIVKKAKSKNVGVMAPVIPPTFENAVSLVKKGVNMLIMGSDMSNFQKALRDIKELAIDKYRGE